MLVVNFGMQLVEVTVKCLKVGEGSEYLMHSRFPMNKLMPDNNVYHADLRSKHSVSDELLGGCTQRPIAHFDHDIKVSGHVHSECKVQRYQEPLVLGPFLNLIFCQVLVVGRQHEIEQRDKYIADPNEYEDVVIH